MFNPFDMKKQDEEAKRKLQKIVTANDFVNIKDIQDNILYTKDNKLFMYLRIQPISLELLSETEKEHKIRQFAGEFSVEKGSYKMFSISRPIDVSGLIHNFTRLKEEETNPYVKKLIYNEINEINKFALSGEIIERQFYMIIWQNQSKDAKKEIMKHAGEIIARFKACEMHLDVCEDTEIKKLLNLFANPNYAHMEDVETDEFIPQLV